MEPLIVPTPTGDQIVQTQTYSYEVDLPLNFPTNQEITEFLQFEADTDFVLQKLTYKQYPEPEGSESLARELDQIPNTTVMIEDTSSGRRYMNQPVFISAIFGSGELPFILREPITIAARSRWLLTFLNLGEFTEPYKLTLVFTGTKIYLEGFS